MQKNLDCLISTNVNPDTGTEEQSNTPVSETDMCPLTQWPSHARRYRPQLQDSTSFFYICVLISYNLLHSNIIICVCFGL
jgi:hypothetical protein